MVICLPVVGRNVKGFDKGKHFRSKCVSENMFSLCVYVCVYLCVCVCDSGFGMNLASYVNSVVKIDSTLSYVIPY